MTDLTRVPGPSSPLQGNSGKIVTVILVGILVAVIKPWGGAPIAAPAVTPTPAPSAPPTSAASAAAPEAFDFGVFEGFEPQPAWEIWPAGREISFGFAMKVDADIAAAESEANASAAPSAGAAPDGSATPRPSPTPSADPAAGPPTWSNAITISPASTLTVVAINMPLAFDIPAVEITRRDGTGQRVAVPAVRLPSPWPDHFLVLGLDDGIGDRRPGRVAARRVRPGPAHRSGWLDPEHHDRREGAAPSRASRRGPERGPRIVRRTRRLTARRIPSGTRVRGSSGTRHGTGWRGPGRRSRSRVRW